MDGRSENIFHRHEAAILAEVARRYDTAPAGMIKHGSFESQVYEFRYREQDRILKLTHSIHRTPELVEAEVDWVTYLALHGVPVYRPTPSINNRLIEVIDGHTVGDLGDDFFIAYSFEKADGRLTRPNDWDEDLIVLWGRALGRMHRATKAYRPPHNGTRRFHWHDDPILARQGKLSTQPLVAAKWRESTVKLRSFPVDEDSYGLIHSDVHHGNFVVNDGGGICIFDFDDCHYGWFGFDISIPLFYALRDEAIDPNDAGYARRFMHRFMTGYSQENRLDAAWIKRIPDFMKFREIDLYSVIVVEGAEEINGWCRRYMKDRRHRIEHDIPVIDLDFSEFA